MKTLIKKLALLASLLMTLMAASAFAQRVSGGGDIVPRSHESSWFLGKGKTITVCLVKNKTFPFSNQELVNDIQKAFLTWERYFSLVKSPSSALEQDFVQPVFNISVAKVCSGKEDLIFYFDVTTPEVSKARNDFFNPIAFAHRNHFESKTGWSKGFIWVAPSVDNATPWTKADNLVHAALLHEIGHVYGFSHVKGTIMTENLYGFIHSASVTNIEYQKALTEKIDHNLQLVSHKEDMIGYSEKSACDLFLGASNCSEEKASSYTAQVKEINDTRYEFIVQIQGKEISTPIELSNHGQTFNSGIAGFGVYLDGEHKVFGLAHASAGQGFTIYGLITTNSGKKMPVIISKNLSQSGDKKMVIEYFNTEGQSKELFSTYTTIY